MAYGLLVDPKAGSERQVEVDVSDYRAIQSAIGGYAFEEHPVLVGTRRIGTIFMVENRAALPTQESFEFDDLLVAGRPKQRIYGTALFVPNSFFADTRLNARYFGHERANEPEPAVVRTMSAAEMKRYISSGEAAEKNATILTTEQFARDWANAASLKSDMHLASHLGREKRDFIPRRIGTFDSARCTVAELESAFLGLYEFLRRDNAFRHDSLIGRAFNAPTFFFPDGLEASEEEFDAGRAVEKGWLSLPFPMPAFWIVHWSVWLCGCDGHEGPVMTYVEADGDGFTTCDAFFNRASGYEIGDFQRHDRLRQSPGALVSALHRLNNRREIIENDIATPALDKVNAGRAKSKHGLAPLPGFIRVTGQVRVDRPRYNESTGIERCRHDRRAHWRKRRNGVELPAEEWVRIRRTTIHPEKAARPPKPYIVVGSRADV
ncbi:hypothetical protein QH494_26245 [Sphingomonas sp. AR_OL41]|uniref:hypothetical protein n=1 Tax=Sphingomonas sp. AR_OL41 TaxID=3042729 RepID=UPI00247FAC38|nr:hypothetical protein [Sphingomonas sp. AR_OL41]MDH7975702.1 hypothetical protein [Sphingomonas sp. AR_OL41]